MSKKSNPFEHPDYRRYAKHFWDKVAPQIRGSGYMLTVAPPQNAMDVQMATELGYSILLDKPLIVMVPTGRREFTAKKLLRIADHVIEGDVETEAGRAAMQAKLTALLKQ